MSDSRVVVVDIGSNSTRLFLCTGRGPDGPEGTRQTVVTGLRRGAAADGSVTDDALARLARCLDEYADQIDAFDRGAPIIAIGTSAVRDAPNQGEIGRIVAEHLGADLTVLSGPQEAELAYTGARLAVVGDDPVIVMDIGGGSTELVRGTGSGPTAAVSLDVGAVRFGEAFLHDDPPTHEQMIALRREVAELAVPALAALGGPAPMIGVAGTMTTIASIANGSYDSRAIHGMVLAASELDEITERVASVDLAARKMIPGLHPDRASTIVAGALIAGTILGAAFADEVAISERDLLDGAILRLAPSSGDD